MIDYFHENPARKGFVLDVRDWHWSSAWHFAVGESPLWIDPIPPEWLDVEA